MRARAVIIGLAGALLIAGFGYLNDEVLGLERFTAGYLLPIIVFILMGLVAGLATFRGPLKPLQPAEMGLILLMLLVPCSVVSRGLLRAFTPTLVMARYEARLRPAWQEHDLVGYVPPRMFPGGTAYDPDVIEGFVSGKGRGRFIEISRVPWAKWRRPLVTWLPMILLSATSMICLGLIVHRQWARHERLRYPIAEFASSLLSGRVAGDDKPLFANRRFWIGLGIVLGIHTVNGLSAWDLSAIQIPRTFSFDQIGQRWPWIASAPRATEMLNVTIYPTVVAFSFFLAAEISLSLGISHTLGVFVGAALVARGIDCQEWHMAVGATAWQRFGAYTAFGVILLYTGRGYYGPLFRRALLPTAPAKSVAGHEVWAARIFLAAQVGLIVLILRLGLDWPLTILTVGMMTLM